MPAWRQVPQCNDTTYTSPASELEPWLYSGRGVTGAEVEAERGGDSSGMKVRSSQGQVE